MKTGFFITATDTDAGKTLISCSLLTLFKQQGLSVVGMKPVASGCQQTSGGLRNDDARQLIENSSNTPTYDDVNPYAFDDAIAPHIAAEKINTHIDIDIIHQAFLRLSENTDCCIVEGVGGWHVPINATQTMADVAHRLQLPVILVVGVRLGCINHALLTLESISQSGVACAGWIANCVESDVKVTGQIITAIDDRFDVPLLGAIPYKKDMSAKDGAQLITIGQITSI